MERENKTSTANMADGKHGYTFGELLAMKRGESPEQTPKPSHPEVTAVVQPAATEETTPGRTFGEILRDPACIAFRAAQRLAAQHREAHIPEQRQPQPELGRLGLDQIA